MRLTSIGNSKNTQCVIYYPHVIEYGGIERNIVALAQAVAARGLSPVLLTHYDLIGMRNIAIDLQVEIAGSGFKSSKWEKIIALRQHLLTLRPRGIPFFLGDRAGHYGVLALISGYAFHYTDPPSLATSADIDPSEGVKRATSYLRDKVLKAVLRRAVYQAATCLTMTKQNAKELQEIYGRSFEVIYQGGKPPDPDFKRLNSNHASGKFILFSISRLNASKNLDWIIDAALAVQNSGVLPLSRKIEIVIGGQGDDQARITAHAREMGLQHELSFLGFLSADALEERYASADIVLVPGRQGYGLPVLEALYRGVPTVLNVESRIAEILTDRADVVISEPNRQSFASATVELVRRVTCNQTELCNAAPLPTESDWGTEIGRRCGWW